ncbi:Phosphate regulon sensor protein PhoR (SphS) [Clostridiaceae bacterium JG1575]|nr:Phosphate regulon sensor protein PhoR (SphS) [Clostridiaceae bacterium JG1575]
MMKLKLQTRITIIYALIFTLVLFAINAAVFLIIRFYNTSSDSVDLLKTRQIVEEVLNQKGTITKQDLDAHGIRFPVVVILRSKDQSFSSIEELTLRPGPVTETMRFRELDDVVEQRAVVLRWDHMTPSREPLQMTVAKSIEQNNFNRTVTLITMAVASLLGMLLSLVVGSYMSHESFKSINSMRKSVEGMDAKNMHARIVVPPTGDELTDLGNTFNSLLDRLDAAYTEQSKFVSDASHELRTPLTVIKGYVDLLSRWGKEDPEILEESIQAIQEETGNMTQLVENLLFIAKGENRKLHVEPARFDLMELISAVCTESSMNLVDRHIECSGTSVDIVADRKMLKQLLRVFIENSAKFTGLNGTIRITLSHDASEAVIRIWDDGDGIAPEDLNRIFERFYVADKARTKNKSGSGLGLSIAEWIVDVHHGTLSVRSVVGEFTEFTVRLPLDLSMDPNLTPAKLFPMPAEEYEKELPLGRPNARLEN